MKVLSRNTIARLSLPMLALGAAYGVYRFNVLFVPHWVALVYASAFELVYIGLALAEIRPDQQKQAHRIARYAVLVSIIYNSLHGLFVLRPALLINKPLWADVAMAVLHGVPIAAMAYAVSVLMVHSAPSMGLDGAGQAEPEEAAPMLAPIDGAIVPIIEETPGHACPHCHTALSAGEYGAAKRWGHCQHCKEKLALDTAVT